MSEARTPSARRKKDVPAAVGGKVMLETSTPDVAMQAALRGERIFGDDFSLQAITQWYEAEVDGYAGLDHEDSVSDRYFYEALDRAYVWRFLPSRSLDVMGLGSAYGSEFRPLARLLRSLTIVEPGRKFWKEEVAGVPARYLSPNPDGPLPLASERFDLVTAFSVLHHVPNVSRVIAELVRVLAPGGLLAIREPITSMGDWTRHRPGLTAHERGLPWPLVGPMGEGAGCTLAFSAMAGFGPLVWLAPRVGLSAPWNHQAFVLLDRLFSRVSAFNYRYHRTLLMQRFAPTIGIWIFRKNEV